MATLIAIGYDNESTAAEAAEEVRRLSRDVIIEPDAVAVISRDAQGEYRVTTNHHPVGAGASWGMFWGLLFGTLFFVPVFGLPVGAGLGALVGKIEKVGIGKELAERVRDMVKPGTSALFLVIERATPDQAVDALSSYGGTVLVTPLSHEQENALQQALRGGGVAASA